MSWTQSDDGAAEKICGIPNGDQAVTGINGPVGQAQNKALYRGQQWKGRTMGNRGIYLLLLYEGDIGVVESGERGTVFPWKDRSREE